MKPLTVIMPENGEIDSTPTYLFDYSQLYRTDARKAGESWFRDATYGLGIHFGLYSLLGKGENALADGVLTPDLYRQLISKLDAMRFDAVELVQFAIANGMRYINFSVRTADGFSLFNTQQSDYNSTRTVARRDFLAELASVCDYHGIGLCLNYSHGRDWSRPEGEPGKKHDVELGVLHEYQEFMLRQIEELLTQYGAIAAICLDGIDVPLASAAAKEFGCQDLYDYVHHLQPQILLSYKQGLLGTEDFFSCDGDIPPEDAPEPVQGFVHKQPDKPLETRICLTPDSYGFHADKAGKHMQADEVWKALTKARQRGTNLLVNTALMPDGSLDYEDMNTLLEIGGRIEKNGYPRVTP